MVNNSDSRNPATNNRVFLTTVEIAGYKSIGNEKQSVRLKNVNVLLGANGSGKSNFISLFKLISYLATEALQEFIGREGFADNLLHYGSKVTSKIFCRFEFVTDDKKTNYSIQLSHGIPDQLFISGEKISYHRKGHTNPLEYYLPGGSRESGLLDDEKGSSKFVLGMLKRIQAFQFHDTSDTAKIRSHGYIDDTRYLRSDGGNLAAFLRAMRDDSSGKKYYQRIVRHIQKIMPQFKDFDIEPTNGNAKQVRLNWRERGSEYLFGPHQISDGSLRFMALTTLLMQPPDLLPSIIVLDEPELGLHPAAIAHLAAMVRDAATRCQIIVATQSTRLVDEFSLDNIIIVESRKENQRFKSEYHRPDEEELQDWLKRYSTSELWEKLERLNPDFRDAQGIDYIGIFDE